MNGTRNIIHVHMAAFAIAVSRLTSPGLRGCPVALVPLHDGLAPVLSASGEARANGVFKGMTLRQAREVCPGLAVIEPDPDAVEGALRAVGRVVSSYTPVWEPAKPGHVYLDLTGTGRLWGKARDAAYRIMHEIKNRVGLTASAGVAGNKMVSCIASRVDGHEIVTDVEYGGEAAFLAPMRVSVIPGIGPEYAKLLSDELDIALVGRLAALDAGSLACIFGRNAHVIQQRAMGFDPSPVTPAEAAFSVREVYRLVRDTNNERLLLRCLYRMVELCRRRMCDRALLPRHASLRIRYSDRVESFRRCRLPRPGLRDFDLYPPVEILFRKAFSRRVRVRRIEVVFRDFSPENGQLSLFHDTIAGSRVSATVEAVDTVRRRYGDEAIMPGRGFGELP